MTARPIRKAVILAGGLGSRFLPMTKAIPKAMLPIVDKPVIQYLVEEAISCGIEDIIIVTGRGKRAIEEHFDHSHELAHELSSRGKTEILRKVEAIEALASFAYVREKEARGDGHAILCAKDLIGNEPFAVLFGDDIIDHDVPALQQLMNIYEEVNAPVICAERVPMSRIHKYGVIDPEQTANGHTKVLAMVEKPAAEDAPSDLGVIGKYICTPEVLQNLQAANSSQSDGELRLIDGFIRMLAEGKELYAHQVEGTRFDTGNRAGLLQANVAYALKNPELREKIQETLRSYL